MINISIVLLLYLAIFGLTEILRSGFRVGSEATRKVAHVASGLAALTLPYFISLTQLTLLALGFFIGLAVSKKLGWLSSIHNVSRSTHGAVVFPLAVLVTAILSWPNHLSAYFFAMLTMAFADTAAALFGRGKRTPTTGSAWTSWRGTAAFFLTTAVVVSFMMAFGSSRPSLSIVVLAPFVLSAVERYTPLGLDNLTVPVAAAILWLL